MKILDDIKLSPKKDCKRCFGKGYILFVRKDLNAQQFREVRSCPMCMRQIIRVEDGDK